MVKTTKEQELFEKLVKDAEVLFPTSFKFQRAERELEKRNSVWMLVNCKFKHDLLDRCIVSTSISYNNLCECFAVLTKDFLRGKNGCLELLGNIIDQFYKLQEILEILSDISKELENQAFSKEETLKSNSDLSVSIINDEKFKKVILEEHSKTSAAIKLVKDILGRVEDNTNAIANRLSQIEHLEERKELTLEILGLFSKKVDEFSEIEESVSKILDRFVTIQDRYFFK